MKLKLFNLNMLQANTWVLIDETSNEAIVIDLGGNYKKVFDYLKEQKAELKFILNTHGHFDHIVGECQMQRDDVFIPVYMSEKDNYLMSDIKDKMHQFGIYADYTKVDVTKFINETSDLKIGNTKITVLETPGHSAGGLSFLIENKLFTGDTLFRGDIGRCDLGGGNFEQLIDSIKTKILPLGDEIEIYPGHGPVSTVAYEKENNSYLK